MNSFFIHMPVALNFSIRRIKEAAQNFDMGAFIDFEKVFSTLVVPDDKVDEFKKLKNQLSMPLLLRLLNI